MKTVKPEHIKDNAFKLISEDWGLLTAGNKDAYNMMTVSWGTMGELWNRKIVIVFVRPQRYTCGFMEKHDTFTLGFFDEKYRDALKLCGSKSGKDIDKTAETGLTPVINDDYVYFKEARLVFVLKKIYSDDLKSSSFLDKTIEKNYPIQDYHRFYIGEIIETLEN